MKAVILAGGRGSRMSPDGQGPPKPLTPIGERTLIEHVIGCFHAQGIDDCLIVTGYRAAQVAEQLSLTVEGSRLAFLDTGPDTPNGGRLRKIVPLVDTTFLLAWADGLWDIDLTGLRGVHRAEGRLVTMAVVNPRSPYGVADLDGPRVTRFEEKPILSDHWTSAGVFAVEPGALARIPGSGSCWEQDVLPVLAEAGELAAYRHRGFWQGVDTPAEAAEMTRLWQAGRAPWVQG